MKRLRKIVSVYDSGKELTLKDYYMKHMQEHGYSISDINKYIADYARLRGNGWGWMPKVSDDYFDETSWNIIADYIGMIGIEDLSDKDIHFIESIGFYLEDFRDELV